MDPIGYLDRKRDRAYRKRVIVTPWGDETSESFSISNGVKQSGVILPLLFSLCIDELFSLLKQSGLGFHVGLTYTGALGMPMI